MLTDLPTIRELTSLNSVFFKMPGLHLELTHDHQAITTNGIQDKERGEMIFQLWGDQLAAVFRMYPAVVCHFFYGLTAMDCLPWISHITTIDGLVGICLIGEKTIFERPIANLKTPPCVGVFGSNTSIDDLKDTVPYFVPGLIFQDFSGNIQKLEVPIAYYKEKKRIRQLIEADEDPAGIEAQYPVLKKVIHDEFVRYRQLSFRDMSNQR